MSTSENPSSECAWCGETLRSAGEFHAVGASVTDPEEIEKHRDGHMVGIELPDADRTVFAITPPEGSPAKREEHDLWFNLCSEACANALEAHLNASSGPVGHADQDAFI